MLKGLHIFYGWWVVIAVFAVVTIGWGGTFYSLLVFYSPILDQFKWTRTEIALGGSLLVATAGIFVPVAGIFVDKYGAKKIILLGLVCIAVSLFGLGLINDLWQYYLACASMGCGLSTIGIMTDQIIASKWFSEKRGLAAGVITSGIGVAGACGPLVATYFIAEVGWRRAVFVLDLFFWLIALPLILFVVKERPEDIGLRPYGIGKKATASVVDEITEIVSYSWREAFGNPLIWLLGVAIFLHQISALGIIQHLVLYANDLGLELTTASVALSAIGLFNLVGKLVFGYLSDRFDKKLMMFCAYSVFALASTTVFVMPKLTERFMMFYACAAIGFGWGGGIITMTLTAADSFGIKYLGKILGTLMVFFNSGGFVGPIITGYLFDYWGNYNRAFMLIVFLGFLSPILILRSRRYSLETIRPPEAKINDDESDPGNPFKKSHFLSR